LNAAPKTRSMKREPRKSSMEPLRSRGPTLTPMQARWASEEARRQIADHVPLRRIGTAADMAQATLFLLSEASSYITGIDLPADGGLLLRM
jgi:NAD(P)-dependent dehydrogenase (short-subunit alcohol dehydrogenase family)